jgi:hypothetical protein
MAYIPELEAGEKLIRQFKVKFSKKAQPFHFAVSDRALYWPEKKLIALNDPFYFRRIPHHQVQTVSLKKLAPYALWLLALLMIIAGLAMGFLLLLPFLEHVPGDHTVSGWPLDLETSPCRGQIFQNPACSHLKRHARILPTSRPPRP